MSLPDTIFIFVLALIIFGPKKLPEIGRQIGRLVGEFRRASNEFKFQIEEELRQVDIADKRDVHPTIGKPAVVPVESSSEEAFPLESTQSGDPEETLPVGQYPNIDTLDTSELTPATPDAFGLSGSSLHVEPESNGRVAEESLAVSPLPLGTLEIVAAPGSQPRISPPIAGSDLPDQHLSSSFEPAAPASRPPARAEAEVSHG